MNTRNLLCIGVLLASNLSINAQDSAISDTKSKCAPVIEGEAAFYQAALALVCMGLSKGTVLSTIPDTDTDITRELGEDIIQQNNIDLQRVAEHLIARPHCGFAKAKVEDPKRFDRCVRYHAVKDFLDIELYRHIYTITFEKVIHYDSNSEEILLFKNILTPREFAETRHWIQAEGNTADLYSFSVSSPKKALVLIKDKVYEIVNQASFDEAFLWLMFYGFRFQDEYTKLKVAGFEKATSPVDFSSKEDMLSLNQQLRTIIEQQELPERRALTRFLRSYEEIINAHTNRLQLFEAL